MAEETKATTKKNRDGFVPGQPIGQKELAEFLAKQRAKRKKK